MIKIANQRTYFPISLISIDQHRSLHVWFTDPRRPSFHPNTDTPFIIGRIDSRTLTRNVR